MEFVNMIQEFWNNLFSKLDPTGTISSLFTVFTVFLIPIYALGVLKYFDALFYRVSQIIVRPINLLIHYLDKSATSTENMKFKHHIANLVLIFAAFGMVITEYSMIQEFLESMFSEDVSANPTINLTNLGFLPPSGNNSSSKVSFLGLFDISTSNVLALTYISVATILGFFVFELNSNFRSVYQKVFEPNGHPIEITNEEDEKRYRIYSIVFLIPLIVLAIIQGFLGYEREEAISGEGSLTTASLLVVTGFLIPIVAGIGLMALHILFAQIALLVKIILEIIKDIAIAFCLKIIALVDFLSALITKTIVLFLGVDGDIEKALEHEREVWNREADGVIEKFEQFKAAVKIRILKRLKPIDVEDDTYSIYILDKLDLQSEYRNAFWKKNVSNSFEFVCNEPSFKLEKNFDEAYQYKTSFRDIAEEMETDYGLKADNIEFKIKDNTFLRTTLKDIKSIKKESDISNILVKDLIGYTTFYVEIKKVNKLS